MFVEREKRNVQLFVSLTDLSTVLCTDMAINRHLLNK